MKNFMLISLITATLLGVQCQPAQPPKTEDGKRQGATKLRHTQPPPPDVVQPTAPVEESDSSSEASCGEAALSSVAYVRPVPDCDCYCLLPNGNNKIFEFGEDVPEQTGRQVSTFVNTDNDMFIIDKLERIDDNLQDLRSSIDRFRVDYDLNLLDFQDVKMLITERLSEQVKDQVDRRNRENLRGEEMSEDDIEEVRRQLHREVPPQVIEGEDQTDETRNSLRTGANDDPLSKIDEILKNNYAAVTLHFRRVDDVPDPESAYMIEYKTFVEKLISIEPFFNGDADIDKRLGFSRKLLELIFNPSLQVEVIPNSEMASALDWEYSDENSDLKRDTLSIVYESIGAVNRMLSGTLGWIKAGLVNRTSDQGNIILRTTYSLLRQVGNILTYLADEEEMEEEMCPERTELYTIEEESVESPIVPMNMPLCYDGSENKETVEPKIKGSNGTEATAANEC